MSALLPPLRLHCQHRSLQGYEKEPLPTKSWGALVSGGRSRSRMTVGDELALEQRGLPVVSGNTRVPLALVSLLSRRVMALSGATMSV